jgi:hypothetical protein
LGFDEFSMRMNRNWMGFNLKDQVSI